LSKSWDEFYNDGIMAVWALGLNHNTAPLDLRGKFAFALESIPPVLSGLKATMQPQGEVALLSTCNRTEIYCAADHLAMQETFQWLAKSGGVSAEDLRTHTYSLQDEHAARHAFRVASGLDSMVLGEPQILGQMKDAVRVASEVGVLGTTLNQLFQRSFSVAKEVRSSTEIGSHSISMAAAAVRLAGQIFEDLSQVKVLFVGAGEMIELSATHFNAKKPLRMAIANRTLERGELLASHFGAESMRLSDLPDRLHEFDVVVSCTASTLPLIGLGAVERALKKRRNRPMFMVDLAVPRDIEPEVKSLSDVYLYTVDDLSGLVQTAQASRQAAVADAEVIIDAGVQSFLKWMDQRNLVPLIQQLNSQAELWRANELQRVKKLLAKGESVDQALEILAKGLTQKMLHGAMAQLNASDPDARERAKEAVEQFFLRDAHSR
jgi:glutamyl-tRNA reductase